MRIAKNFWRRTNATIVFRLTQLAKFHGKLKMLRTMEWHSAEKH